MAWCQFLEAPEFERYAKELLFWQLLLKFLEDIKQEDAIYDYLIKKFKRLLKDGKNQYSEEIKAEIQKVIAKCRSTRRNTSGGNGTSFWRIAWKVIVVVLIRYFLRQIF